VGGGPPEALPRRPGVSDRLSPVFEELLAANETHVEQRDGVVLPARAAKGLAVVTCMDSRLDPFAILGLEPGDAVILRNAGGRVTPDTLRSLLLATRLLGVSSVVVMHHSLCALAGIDDEALLARLGLDETQVADFENAELLAMPEPDLALAGDVERIRSSNVLDPDLVVEGWRYDLASGRVERLI
jgi:carbonic anhydrase